MATMITETETRVANGAWAEAEKPEAKKPEAEKQVADSTIAIPAKVSLPAVTADPGAPRESAEPSWAILRMLRKIRLMQIRTLATLLIYMGRVSAGGSIVLFARSLAPVRWVLERLLGYRRSFRSFAEARSCSTRYISAGHEHEDDIRMHISSSRVARESDYPVFYWLSQSGEPLRGVFDFGGNIGNLFYCYQNYLPFPPDISWKVYDLPELRAAGEKLGAERAESRIRYVESLEQLDATDLFLASGSLHYFESSLPELLAQAKQLPRRVLVNRTPFSDAGELLTIQDNGTFLVPCKLHNKRNFLAGMARLGYELRSSWPVAERALYVPLHPDCSSATYFGFYFELDVSNGRMSDNG
ncbi:MAG TPA: methyltransferase, TIGR04325 family [Candidatus Sulfotelmatobacter sp.]